MNVTPTTYMFMPVLFRELVPTADINLVASLMQLLHSLLDEWRAADAAKSPVSDLRVDLCTYTRHRACRAAPE